METNSMPAPRTSLNQNISFKRNYAREESMGYLKNVSITGAFLTTAELNMSVGEKIHLNFTVAGRKRVIHAKVIWTNAIGVGLKFLPTNNRDTQIVDDLIYFVESTRENKRSVLDDIFKKVG